MRLVAIEPYIQYLRGKYGELYSLDGCQVREWAALAEPARSYSWIQT
jgi:hypothetical protein